MENLKLTGVRDVSATAEVGVDIPNADHPHRSSVVIREPPGMGSL